MDATTRAPVASSGREVVGDPGLDPGPLEPDGVDHPGRGLVHPGRRVTGPRIGRHATSRRRHRWLRDRRSGPTRLRARRCPTPSSSGSGGSPNRRWWTGRRRDGVASADSRPALLRRRPEPGSQGQLQLIAVDAEVVLLQRAHPELVARRVGHPGAAARPADAVVSNGTPRRPPLPGCDGRRHAGRDPVGC